MTFTVIYDASVLFPAPLRDLLIRLAQVRLFHGRWTERIEVVPTLVEVEVAVPRLTPAIW